MLSTRCWLGAALQRDMVNNLSIDSGWAALGAEALVFLVAMAAGWTRMTSKINGYGVRQKNYEQDCAKFEGELRQLSLQFTELIALSNRVSTNEGKIAELSEGLIEARLLFVAKVGEVQNTMSDRNGVLGERIARLEPKGGRDV